MTCDECPGSDQIETMTKHKTGTRKEWLATRLELLNAEKELTRRSDELARKRQELPWVRVDKEYRFETDEGMERMGLSDIEGKTTRVGASKRGSERVSKASLADLSANPQRPMKRGAEWFERLVIAG